MSLVSIVIPIYNSEKYLSICLESVMSQSYRNIEIILIDDGSIDNSGKICDDFAKMDLRIKSMHIANSGVAIARNIGIKKAIGQYIAFLDSDDVMEGDFIKKAVNMIKTAEYVSSAFVTINEKGITNIFDYLKNSGDVISIKEYLSCMANYQAGAYWGANWGKLYLRSIIVENEIQFEQGVLFAEDFRFNIEYLKHVRNVALIHEPLYRYRIDTSGSLSKKEKNPQIYWKEYLTLFRRYKALFIEQKVYEKNEAKIYSFLLRAYTIILRGCIRNQVLDKKSIIAMALDMSNTPEFMEAKQYSSYFGKREQRILEKIINHKIDSLVVELFILEMWRKYKVR